MEEYDPEGAPEPFGLENPGSLCYFNSLLQVLAGCTAFRRAVLAAGPAGFETATGRALEEFFRRPGAGRESAAGLYEALRSDLAARKPAALKAFGPGQNSATEAFLLLLEMLEAPGAPGAEAPGAEAGGRLAALFRHRFRCEIFCPRCRAPVSKTSDSALSLYLGHLDGPAPPRTAEAFSRAVSCAVSAVEDFACPACPGAPKGGAVRVYSLTMVPEVLFCHFNRYAPPPASGRFFPEFLAFPALGGGALRFRLVGQIEHSGGLEGGHYWARALRRGGSFCLNDAAVSRAPLAPTANTYVVVYHYAGREGAPSPGS